MNILAKSTVVIFLLFIGGCAHHSGYYAGRSHIGRVGISVDSYIPYNAYPVDPFYHDHNVYLRRPFKRKYKAFKPRYDDYYYDHNRSFNKHYSRRDYGRQKRAYAYKRQGKGERGYGRRRVGRDSNRDSYRYR